MTRIHRCLVTALDSFTFWQLIASGQGIHFQLGAGSRLVSNNYSLTWNDCNNAQTACQMFANNHSLIYKCRQISNTLQSIRVCLHWSEQLVCTVNWLFSIKQMWFCRLIAVLQQSQQLRRNFCFRPMRFWLDCACRQQQICNMTRYYHSYLLYYHKQVPHNWQLDPILLQTYSRLIADWCTKVAKTGKWPNPHLHSSYSKGNTIASILQTVTIILLVLLFSLVWQQH